MTAVPRALPASMIAGAPVVNTDGDELGHLAELVVEMASGRIAYAVLSHGGLLGIGDKLFAVPWAALRPDPENERFVLGVTRDVLEQAPGFDKDNWPDMADRDFHDGLHDHYGVSQPAWA